MESMCRKCQKEVVLIFLKIRKESVSAGFVRKYPKTFRAGMSPVRQQNRGGEGIDEKDWETQQEEKVSEGG